MKLHYIRLHYITLHHITLHYILLHYIPLRSIAHSYYICINMHISFCLCIYIWNTKIILYIESGALWRADFYDVFWCFLLFLYMFPMFFHKQIKLLIEGLSLNSPFYIRKTMKAKIRCIPLSFIIYFMF